MNRVILFYKLELHALEKVLMFELTYLVCTSGNYIWKIYIFYGYIFFPPVFRRREVNMSNGAGGNGNADPTTSGFYPPHGYLPHQYVRTPYPGGFPGGGAAGFMRPYAPFQQPNGELVYTYPPPPGGFPIASYSIPQGSQVLQQPPPPQQQQQQPQVPSKPHQPPPLSCYNCGSQSHSAIDCPEATIEEVTKLGIYLLIYFKM